MCTHAGTHTLKDQLTFGLAQHLDESSTTFSFPLETLGRHPPHLQKPEIKQMMNLQLHHAYLSKTSVS